MVAETSRSVPNASATRAAPADGAAVGAVVGDSLIELSSDR
jgi:hypothetical protein